MSKAKWNPPIPRILFYCPLNFVVVSKESAIRNIEGFDKTKLKHAETAEKQALPDTEGMLVYFVI